MTLLSHTIAMPEIRAKPLNWTLAQNQNRWQRQAQALWLIAQGFALRAEVQRILLIPTSNVIERSGALSQVIPDLVTGGYLVAEKRASRGFANQRTIPMHLVRLSEKGTAIAQSLGWTIGENEWERVERIHQQGKEESQHTLAILCFCYQARLRGYQAGVMPDIVNGGRFAPDVVIDGLEDEPIYVEVETVKRHTDKPRKWQLMAEYQGNVALYALNPAYRARMIANARSAVGAKLPILATDLQTLFTETRNDYRQFRFHSLWA